MADTRYLENPEGYLELAFRALRNHFETMDSLRNYYKALANDEARNEFLRLASFYLYLVKEGDWHIRENEKCSVVDYLTETHKATALFSLIEAAGGGEHQDFFAWLVKHETFPISDRRALRAQHEEYLNSYGSIRRCVNFFSLLPGRVKERLCAGVILNGTQIEKIEELARYLYTLRSKFVHEARLVLELNRNVVVSVVGNKRAITSVSLADLMSAFEEGLVISFRQRR